MKKRLFPLLITLSALAVSGSAAFYSVFGLSKLFAGAATQVIIMAGSLEFAKLVVASLLYQYWDTINKWLRTYLAIAVLVLMVITSGGIYGFLSGAYQSTATQSELLDKSLLILNQKQIRFQETKEDITLEKTQITKSISDLRISLSTPGMVSYWDENSQTVITTTSSSTRRALQSELKTAITYRDNLNIKLEAILDSIGKTDMGLLDKEISNEGERELGPLKYLAETTGYPMNEVVNWFLLLIILVFDPLAIALVIASNMAFAKLKKPEDNVIEGHIDGESIKEEQKEIDEDYFTELHDYIEFTKEDLLDDLTYPQFIGKHHHNPEIETPTHNPDTDELDLTSRSEEDERRMDIIGQNGNDGLHYEKEIEEPRIIKSEDDLNEKELEELSKEVGRVEKEIDKKNKDRIQPTHKDLEKLAKALNIVNEELEPEKEEGIVGINNEYDKLGLEEFFLREGDGGSRKQLYDLLVYNGYDKAFLRKKDTSTDYNLINTPNGTTEEDVVYSEDEVEDYRLTDTTQTLITKIVKEESIDETTIKYKGRK